MNGGNQKITRNRPMLYLASLFAIVIISGLIYSSCLLVRAQSYAVTATVPAPALITPATITSPQNGAVVGQSTITVSGTCPSNSYVRLLRNGYPSGVAVCQPGGNYQIQTVLSPGVNVLVAQDYNITNDVGPDSAPISVTYLVPASNQPQTSADNQGITNVPNSPSSYAPNYDGQPLALYPSLPYTYTAVSTGKQLRWGMDVQGGKEPYFVTVQWGDGETANLLLKKEGLFYIRHIYGQAGTYNVMVSAVDSEGNKVVYQMSVSVRSQLVAGAQNTDTANFGALKVHRWQQLVWPIFSILILMLLSFWLGERKAYRFPSRRQQSKAAKKIEVSAAGDSSETIARTGSSDKE